MKKIKYICVIISILLLYNKVCYAQTIENYINENGISITQEQYKNFKLVGLTDQEIKTMPLETYDKYKIIEFVKVDKEETKFFRETTINSMRYNNTIVEEITEQEYKNETLNNNLIIPYDTTVSHETTYKKITLTSLEISHQYPNVRTVTSSLTWKQLPSVRSHEIYAARVTNGEIAQYTYSGSMTSTETSFDENCGINGRTNHVISYPYTRTSWNLSNASIGFSGIGYTGKLKNNSEYCLNDLGMFFSTAVGYSSTLTFQSVTGATVYVTYQHATKNVELTDVLSQYTFSNSGLGNVVYFSNVNLRNSYDGMGGVHLTL